MTRSNRRARRIRTAPQAAAIRAGVLAGRDAFAGPTPMEYLRKPGATLWQRAWLRTHLSRGALAVTPVRATIVPLLDFMDARLIAAGRPLTDRSWPPIRSGLFSIDYRDKARRTERLYFTTDKEISFVDLYLPRPATNPL